MINMELLEGCSALDFSIHEDLGDVDYIFSDKTGTLTANILTFQGCSVQGESFYIKKEEEREFMSKLLRQQHESIDSFQAKQE